MPTLDDVYRKFGEVSEAAQLLETEIGTLLLAAGAINADLLEHPDPVRGSEIYNRINHKTLGQLIKGLKNSSYSVFELEELLSGSLAARNSLAHSFYRKHNFRRNSEKGRSIMMDDLESIHKVVLDAYKAVMLLSGIDLDKIVIVEKFDDDDAQSLDYLPIP